MESVNLTVVGVVLMVVWIAGVVLWLITARRTEVVHQTARVDRVEPQRVDDPRV